MSKSKNFVTVLLLDTETTGTSHQDQIIEYAHTLFLADKNTGQVIKVLDEYSALREPTVPITPFAQRVHGLGMDQLIGQALDLGHIEKSLTEAQLLLAHNVSFDKRFVSSMISSATSKEWRCTMRSVDWLSQGIASRKMEDIIRFYNIEAQARHRAADDVRCTLTAIQQRCVLTGKPHLWQLLN